MENRAKVICHMFTTIDGKISIDFTGNEDYQQAEVEYEQLVYSYGEAFGCGRATFETGIEADLSKYKDVPVRYEDRVILPTDGQHLWVAFDRFGKLRWESNTLSYGGKDYLLLEALTENVAPEFLAYLDELGIPYLFAGKEEFDPELFLQKLKKLFHVDTFALCGGAQINAEFMKRELVDEISLIIGPAVDGNRDALTFVGTEDTEGFPQFFKLKGLRRIGDSGVLLNYTR